MIELTPLLHKKSNTPPFLSIFFMSFFTKPGFCIQMLRSLIFHICGQQIFKVPGKIRMYQSRSHFLSLLYYGLLNPVPARGGIQLLSQHNGQ